MFINYNSQTRQMLIGNLLLVACCAFYLAWWLIAFKPKGAIKGIKSGWLLIFAFIFGLAGVIQIVKGSKVSGEQLFSRSYVMIVGVVCYVILLMLTAIFLKRQVTTELFLIIGWMVIAFMELNALYSLGELSKGLTIFFLVTIVFMGIISLICYLLYYGLDSRKGYIDGMIPLLLVAIMMVVVTISVIVI